MEGELVTVLAMERVIVPAAGRAAAPRTEKHKEEIDVSVVFTSPEATLAVLKDAGGLASSLGVRITLLVAQIVPYPLPLNSPPVLVEFNEKRFRLIAGESRVETTIQIYLCRDRVQMLTSVLKPGSIVLVGGRKRWWPSSDEWLSRKLRRAGYEVIFKPTD